MKFIQVAVACASEGSESLYALGDDGILYVRRYAGGISFGKSDYREFWEAVDTQIGDPADEVHP